MQLVAQSLTNSAPQCAAKRKTSKRKTTKRKTTKRKTSKRKTTKRKASKRKYSRGASKQVEGAMHEMHQGKLKSGRSGKKVKSRKQAIAIGLSEARKKGAKVPPRKKRG